MQYIKINYACQAHYIKWPICQYAQPHAHIPYLMSNSPFATCSIQFPSIQLINLLNPMSKSSPISDRPLVYYDDFVVICASVSFVSSYICGDVCLWVTLSCVLSNSRNCCPIVIKFPHVVHINNISVKFVNGRSRSKVIDAMTSSMANSFIAIDSLIFIRIFSNSQDKRTSMLSNVMPNGAHFR